MFKNRSLKDFGVWKCCWIVSSIAPLLALGMASGCRPMVAALASEDAGCDPCSKLLVTSLCLYVVHVLAGLKHPLKGELMQAAAAPIPSA